MTTREKQHEIPFDLDQWHEMLDRMETEAAEAARMAMELTEVDEVNDAQD